MSISITPFVLTFCYSVNDGEQIEISHEALKGDGLCCSMVLKEKTTFEIDALRRRNLPLSTLPLATEPLTKKHSLNSE